MVHVLAMDLDSVGVEAQKCEVKDEPKDVIREDVLEENSVSDEELSTYSDIKNEVSTGHVLEVDADSVGVETLVVFCDVKDENDPGDVDEDVLEESSVSDEVPSADSHDDFVITVKEEQIEHRTNGSSLKEPMQDVRRSSENTTYSNLNEHKLVQDTFKKLHEVTAADITDDNKERPASVQYRCGTCQQCYSSRCELDGHLRLCSDVWKKDLSREKPYQCNACKKRFLRLHHLTRHMFVHANEVPYQCYVCKRQFSQKDHLIRHMRTHTDEKPYHCCICKKQFSRKSNVTSHMLTHNGAKPHHCGMCEKRFSRKAHLISHIRTHTGEKLYHCETCKKQFSRKVHLIEHMRTHTGERPHHCDICHKQFSRKYHLIRHVCAHTGEKPYHCSVCKRYFTRKSSLIEHMCKHTDTLV